MRRSRSSGRAGRAIAALLTATTTATLAVAVTALTATTAQASTPPANALSCLPEVPVLAKMGTEFVRVYRHNDSVAGSAAWSETTELGGGFPGRVFASAGRVAYNMRPNGEFYRMENFDKSTAIKVSEGWFGWDLDGYRNRITFDSAGDLWTVESDNQLRRFVYDATTKRLEGEVVEAGWGRFNLIVAAGDGVLYARDPNVAGGSLLRFQWDKVNRKWLQRDGNAGSGWNMHSGLFSPGGDVIFGRTQDNGPHGYPGELFWYRMDQQGAGSLADRTYNGWGWSRDWDVTAQTDACKWVPSNAATITCASTVPFMAKIGDVPRKYYYNDPANGTTNWGTDHDVAPSFAGRLLSSKDNIFYNVRTNGDVFRMEWTGSEWKKLDGDSIHKKIASGWSNWDQAEYRNRITIDSRGDFFTVQDDGKLRWKRHVSGEQWDVRVIDTGWLKFDLITAAGDGVIYARDKNANGGTLYRFQYDVPSQRWVQQNSVVSGGWNRYSRVFSPGADILYSTTAEKGEHVDQFGEITWTRLDENGQVLSGRRYNGWGWNKDWDVTAQSNACVLTRSITPQRPAVVENDKTPLLLQNADGALEHFYTASKVLYHGRQHNINDLNSVQFRPFTSPSGFVNKPAAAFFADGRLQLVGQNFDSEFRGARNNIPNGLMSDPYGMGGFMASNVALLKGPGDKLYSFAVDAQGRLWWRDQDGATEGDLDGWNEIAGGGGNSTRTPAVAVQGNGFRIVTTDTTGSLRTATLIDGKLSAWISFGGKIEGTPALVIPPDGAMRVFARRADNRIHLWGEGFSDWQTLPGAVTMAGSPAALWTPAGNLAVVVRSAAGPMYETSPITPGGEEYREWKITGQEFSGTDASVLALKDGTWAFTFRSKGGTLYLYRDVSNQNQQPAARTASAEAETKAPAFQVTKVN
ncbi:tachylectin-related carbohydrate-binding protein [Streptomyces sp. ID05-26A]|nr:tachylectin-related carbohydrate-binding protein [Streptomyces sp. ID05-26A]